MAVFLFSSQRADYQGTAGCVTIWSMESSYKLAQVVGRIHFLVAGGLNFLFSHYQLGTALSF